jgi:hypothetical protein
MKVLNTARLPLYFVVFASISVILNVVLLGFSIWLPILVIFWIGFYLLFVARAFPAVILSSTVIWIILGVLILLSIGSSIGTRIINDTSDNEAGKISAAACQPYYDQYNNKVFSITGSGIQGSIGLTIDLDGCTLESRYIILVDTDLAKNKYDGLSDLYNYLGYNYKSSTTTRSTDLGTGLVAPAYKNTGNLPDAFATTSAVSTYYGTADSDTKATSSWFYNTYSIKRTYSAAEIQTLLDTNTFEIIDSTPYIEKTELTKGNFSYSINETAAYLNGTVAKSFSYNVSN